MVTAAARRSPAEIAVTFGDHDVTYAELDRRADDVATRLLVLGVGPDRIVVVLLDRSEDLVMALLAVAKSGAAFMPLDPGQPANRIAAMIGASGAPVVVTHERNLQLLKGFAGHRLCLDLPGAPVGNGRCRIPLCRTAGRAGLRHPHLGFHGRPSGCSTPTAGCATCCSGCRRTTGSTPATGCCTTPR